MRIERLVGGNVKGMTKLQAYPKLPEYWYYLFALNIEPCKEDERGRPFWNYCTSPAHLQPCYATELKERCFQLLPGTASQAPTA